MTIQEHLMLVSVYPDDVVITGEPLGFAVFPRKRAAPPAALSINDAAQYLGITSDQVRAFIDDGELKYINVGRGKKRPRIRLTKADLDEFIERRTQRESPSCPSTNQRSQRRTTGSTSKSEADGFMARRAAQLAKKPNK
ncbi:helix-turn-helix domain-containing protein [Bradyrhizobium sp. URHC0002]